MKSFKSLVIVMVVLMTVVFSGCKEDQQSSQQSELNPVKLSASQRRVVSKYNDLSIQAFTQTEIKGQNSVISPLFLSIALGAQANLHDEANANAIAKSLSVTSLDELNELNRLLRASLPKVDKSTSIEFYSNLWLSKEKFPGIESKRQLFEDFYSCPMNLKEKWSESEIGTAVSEWSKKYDAIICGGEIAAHPDLGSCVQTNIIKFKGKWTNPWEAKDTKKEDFTNADGTKSSVEMMYGQASNCKYQNKGSYSFVTLPFGNGSYNLVVVKTENGSKIGDVRKEIDWTSVMSDVESGKYHPSVSVILPKFSFSNTCQADIEEILESYGFKGQLYGFGASHTVDFKIDEEGAEAIIKPVMVIAPMPEKTIKFKVNSPFIFALIERTSKSIVLLGEMNHL